jgi:hypothetical protein
MNLKMWLNDLKQIGRPLKPQRDTLIAAVTVFTCTNHQIMMSDCREPTTHDTTGMCAEVKKIESLQIGCQDLDDRGLDL